MVIIARNFIILITVALTFSIGYFKPAHNMDMIGYVASAFHADGLSGIDLLEATYSDVDSAVSEETFSTHTTLTNYRATVYQDYRSLEQQLPFYTPRVLYIGAMKLLATFGFSYSEGTYLISSIFASASVLVIAVMLKQLSLPVYLLPFIVVMSGLT